jgi:acetyl esterase/lipase
MQRRMVLLGALCVVLAAMWVSLPSPTRARGQLSESASWAATLASEYRITPNITYLTANNWEAKLDVYQPAKAAAPMPTLILFHGGGWVGGDRIGTFLNAVPYLEMGWAVVNVSYRLARVSLAPAAVEDCRCALRWVISKAKDYNFDINKLVVTGHSAGGHLSLMSGMLPGSAGLDRQCPGNEELKVAAIINWYGITDVGDLLEGPNQQTYAVTWLSSLTNRDEIARRASPLTYVRAGLPPILTIHGDADTVVPYSHATRLHEALTKAGVANQLLTIPGGKHGGFSPDETLKIFTTIQSFLIKHNLLNGTTSAKN